MGLDQSLLMMNIRRVTIDSCDLSQPCINHGLEGK